jgi:hypothetical protein
VAKLTKDDLPKIGVSRLRALGVITPEMTSVEVEFEGGVRRRIRVVHRRLRHGGGWSFFLCPKCERRARTLRLLDGAPVCQWCDGLKQRVQVEPHDKRERIARLKTLVNGGNAYLKRHKHHRDTCDRKRQLTYSLRRALIAQRRADLGLKP